uniref:Uncharacterized protein n=1 Tax=Arundo donax TaxID=35708 RepID=A0A0A9BFJ4_ARUDO
MLSCSFSDLVYLAG